MPLSTDAARSGVNAAPLTGGAATVPAWVDARAAADPTGTAYWWLEGGTGRWRPVTWADHADRVARLAGALREYGLGAGQRIGILAPTSYRWELFQHAALRLGAVVVGLDPHERDENLEHAMGLVKLDAVAVGDAALAARIPGMARARMKLAVSLADTASDGTDGLAWAELDPGGRKDIAAAPDVSEPAAAAIVVFTSGTTGAPRAVGYTHEQVVVASEATVAAFPDIGQHARLACWLPLSNLFQRMLNYCAIVRGAQTFLVEDPRRIMSHVTDIAPHVFIGVPRFYEKLYEGVQDRLARAPRPIRSLARWALEDGSQRPANARPSLGKLLANLFVVRRLRGLLGRNLRYGVSGSAPMPEWLLRWFDRVGLPILEAYGTSEVIVPIALNRPGARKPGTVGRPLPPNEVRISAEGEVEVRGPGVAGQFYGGSPRFTDDGFLCTGDFGYLDNEGFLVLEGRRGDVFKTSTGRKIVPQAVEEVIQRAPGIEHAAVFGAGRHWLVAVVAPTRDGAAPPPVQLGAAIGRRLEVLPPHQRPAAVVVAKAPFSIDRGELTANFKLRRSAIETRYRAAIAEAYGRLARGELGEAEGPLIVEGWPGGAT